METNQITYVLSGASTLEKQQTGMFLTTKGKVKTKYFYRSWCPKLWFKTQTLVGGSCFCCLFFLASEESLSLVLIPFFSVQFQKFNPPTGLNLA